MSFVLYLRHRNNFQPEPPQILDRNINDPDVKFTFVDFIPSVIKRSGTLVQQFQVEYHSFSTMIEIANQWLQNHGQQWEVVNCETIIILFKYDETNNYELKPNDCCFYIYGSEKNNILRALRLWIRRRIPLDKNINSSGLNFIDYCPKYNKNLSEFENLDDVIKRINNDIQTNGMNGRIISIESVAFDANLEWEIDTETSLSTLSTRNVFILRIFYEPGLKTYFRIGIEDFHPELKSRATFFKRPRFETFDKVIEKGAHWLRKNPQKRFINAQSIDIKIKSPKSSNSRLMAYTEHGDYMRVFRITFIELDSQVSSSSSSTISAPQITLATKMFLPCKKSDTIADLTQRLHEWINQYLEKQKRLRLKKKCIENIDGGASTNDNDNNKTICEYYPPTLLTAETLEVYAKDVRHDNRTCIEKAANEDTFLANRFGNKNAYLFFSFNLFYDSSLIPSSSSTDSCTNITTLTSTTTDNSSWSIDTLVSSAKQEDLEEKSSTRQIPYTHFNV